MKKIYFNPNIKVVTFTSKDMTNDTTLTKSSVGTVGEGKLKAVSVINRFRS